MFNETTFSIWRLSAVSGNKKSFQDTGNTLSGLAGPVDTEVVMLTEGSFSKSYKITSDNFDADVKDGDMLKGGGAEYMVKGVQKFDFMLKHLEIVAEKTSN